MKRITAITVLLLTLMLAVPVSARPINFSYSVDVLEDNPDNFWSDRSVYNRTSGEWEPPEWYQLFWNETSQELDPPPIENQMRSFDFTMTTNVNATKVVAVYSTKYPATFGYLGPPNDYDWMATNGVILNASGPYADGEPMTGYLDANLWNQSLWMRIYCHGSYYDPYYNSSISYGDIHYFYLNTNSDVIDELTPPTEEIPVSVDTFSGIVQTLVSIFSKLWKLVISI